MAIANLMMEITSRYSNMTRAEKKVADFVLSSPQKALNSTITELSRLSSVGETSVFRFCRTLSFKGYQDFRMSLALSTSSPDAPGLQQFQSVGCLYYHVSKDTCRPLFNCAASLRCQ